MVCTDSDANSLTECLYLFCTSFSQVRFLAAFLAFWAVFFNQLSVNTTPYLPLKLSSILIYLFFVVTEHLY